MSNIYGRQVVVPLTNKSGGSVVAGDVVIVDTSNNDAFTTTTSAGITVGVGVAQEAIANNATGRVLVGGYAALVNVNASVTRGHYGATHTVAKQAAGQASRGTGTFCQFLTGGTTPDALVYPTDLLGSSLTNPMTTAGDIIIGGASGVPARLAIGAAGAHLSRINGALAYDSGTSNPGSAAAGDRYWRTDLGLSIYYDGTRWLTTDLSSAAWTSRTTGTAIAATAFVGQSPMHHDWDWYVERIDWAYFIVTTNDGSNNWTLAIQNLALSDLYTVSTSAAAANTWTHVESNVGAELAKTNLGIFLKATKVSSPGALTTMADVRYRLKIT